VDSPIAPELLEGLKDQIQAEMIRAISITEQYL